VGGNGSGGTIGSMNGADGGIPGTGIYLNNVRNITLRRMTLNGTKQNFGIRGYLVNGFILEYATVTGTNGTSPSLPAPENYGEGSVYLGNSATSGVSGTATFTNDVINGGRGRNLSIVNTASGSTTLTIKGCNFGAIQNFIDGGHSLAVVRWTPGILRHVDAVFLGRAGGADGVGRPADVLARPAGLLFCAGAGGAAMRLLVLDQFSDPGGAQQCLAELLPAMADRGWYGTVAMPGEGALFDCAHAAGFETERIRFGPYRSGGRSLGEFFRFTQDSSRLAWRIRAMA